MKIWINKRYSAWHHATFRYDIHFVSDFYFVRQPSHRLKWQEDRTGDRWTWKHSSHISNRSFKKKGKVWLKSLGTPSGGSCDSLYNLAYRPEGLLSLKRWYKENRGGSLETLLSKGSGSRNAPRRRCTLHLCRCWKDAETASPLRLGVRNIQRAGTTDFQMLRPLAPNIIRQGVNTWSLAYPSRIRSHRFHRWSMVKSGAFPSLLTL